ncbi:hypothetical protein ABE493_16555 [Stenotrophomonas terrae]|uniref:hypothetical protein n=1 Tax=Stenotrophomonas terrae TaxID=405446 RepID=UPI003208F6F2
MRVLLVLVSALLSSCDSSKAYDVCKYRGNSGAERVCSLSFLYLAAHPEKFDAVSVEFVGWARVAGDSILIFPTLDAMEGGDSVSSVVVYDGNDSFDELNLRGSGSRIRISGIFHLNDGKLDPMDIERIGVIQHAKFSR